MIQRFIRCPHCGLPHPVEQAVCPGTGQALRTKSSRPPRPVARAGRSAMPGAPRESAAPPSRPAVAGHLLGRTIGGRYRVRGVLGEGGMGTVFEAEHIALGRSVAVKVLRATQARKRKTSIRRFHQEARAAGAIGHPNICGVIDLGTLDDGSPYIVMERLIGETLADRIASEGGLPFEDVVDILTQVLSGLVAAHEQQIVHRDIKPENVFLTRRVGCPPLVKLLDFGVSKMTGLPVAGARQEDLDPHAHRHGHGHAVLHGARAGARRARPRRAGRSLRLRCHPLRGADGQAALHRRELQRAPGADPVGGAAARERASPRASRRRSTR